MIEFFFIIEMAKGFAPTVPQNLLVAEFAATTMTLYEPH
jgi:hypothetical protein